MKMLAAMGVAVLAQPLDDAADAQRLAGAVAFHVQAKDLFDERTLGRIDLEFLLVLLAAALGDIGAITERWRRAVVEAGLGIGAHHDLDLLGVDLARRGIEGREYAADQARMRTFADILRRRDQLDARLLQLAAIALALILVAEEAAEVVDEHGVVSLRLRAGVRDHPLQCRAAIGHAGLARLDIGLDDLVAALGGTAGDAHLLLVERGLVLRLPLGADPHIGAGAQARRVNHRQGSSQGRRP
ncbi:hypothetical protein [uncultured Sphingomonas sp.]|uniref:hypothetical protein n=1 Tax=uncultured Sphingomonas sp. TaxID=158754 RepID=UPI0030DD3267